MKICKFLLPDEKKLCKLLYFSNVQSFPLLGFEFQYNKKESIERASMNLSSKLAKRDIARFAHDTRYE